MKSSVLTSALLASSLLALSVSGCASNRTDRQPVGPVQPPAAEPTAETLARVKEVLASGSSEELVAFASTDALGKHLSEMQEEKDRRYRSLAKGGSVASGEAGAPSPSAADAGAPMAEPVAEMESEDDSSAGGDESITNTQEAGVDEGGIVKTHGDHLVVLRRGRLFTVDTRDQDLRPTSAIDVSPNAVHDAWYDEMLISGNTIVVVGFSYEVGATELGLFHIDARGQLSRKDTFLLRSNDYYSSRNYASRLIGNKLVFYMPHYLGYWDESNPNLPAVAGLNARTNRADDWDLVVDGSKVYQAVQQTDEPVLHTVITCDLGKGNFACDAQGILGPPGRNFYVSSTAVYVWTHDGMSGRRRKKGNVSTAAVYRLPLNGGRVGALRTWGAPVDQFSFKESSDGHLNVLLRAEGKGDAMWSPEFSTGDVGMMRVPVAAFDRGVSTVRDSAFVDLPDPSGGNYYAFQNRFVGDYLLYGMGSGWGGAAQDSRGTVFAHAFASGRDGAQQVSLAHGVDRIEAMGRDAVVVGTDGRNLHFSAIELGARPNRGGAYVQRNASQGELRSHGFFYKPSGRDEGTLGLPIQRGSAPGYAHLTHGSAEILFLDVDDLNFRELGALASDPRASQEDKCTVSCVDWYGNARPIFYKGRVFALLGYELVEGKINRGSIKELRRANMLNLVTRRRDDAPPPWKK